jgi:hypothetical protein
MVADFFRRKQRATGRIKRQRFCDFLLIIGCRNFKGKVEKCIEDAAAAVAWTFQISKSTVE